LTRDLSGKRLELLKEVVPGVSRVGILWDANAPGPSIVSKSMRLRHLLKRYSFNPWKCKVPTLIWKVHSKPRPRDVLTRSSRLQVGCLIVTTSGLQTLL